MTLKRLALDAVWTARAVPRYVRRLWKSPSVPWPDGRWFRTVARPSRVVWEGYVYRVTIETHSPRSGRWRVWVKPPFGPKRQVDPGLHSRADAHQLACDWMSETAAGMSDVDQRIEVREPAEAPAGDLEQWTPETLRREGRDQGANGGETHGKH